MLETRQEVVQGGVVGIDQRLRAENGVPHLLVQIAKITRFSETELDLNLGKKKGKIVFEGKFLH